ncbi:unnamed protein product [Cyprideis torosa]|uniref:BOS complex subunit NCLN n=1 Tax=Cyprideis torosa TaxID=163714 RepID=A0A7R8ZKV6_9CRUS|nr:unnamed protein product [Cyprideis torosa]CAG0885200.1 unnamed protein product [Cyprideis torosa]
MTDPNEFFEIIRGVIPLSLLVVLPIFIIVSPGPVAASHEFNVYRMQHYDLFGVAYGSRNSLLSLEARTVDSGTVTRRCILIRWQDLSQEVFEGLSRQNAGGLLVLLPQNISSLSPAVRRLLILTVHDSLIGSCNQEMMEKEQSLLYQKETQIPVYFATETDELNEVYDEVQRLGRSDKRAGATQALVSAVIANGFQLYVGGPQPNALSDAKISSLQGLLRGLGAEESLPTIAVVAHYDAFGIAPGLSFGADSNASGMAILLELIWIFSTLYSNSRTHGKGNLLFFVSGGGKINYQGSKKWLEDQLDGLEAGILQDCDFTLVLDTLGQGNKIRMHVSKPPKDGKPADLFFKDLEAAADRFATDVSVEMNHKKINLNTESLAWEHERFSLRKIPAYTLSHLESHKDPVRRSIFDVTYDLESLVTNTKIIAEALAHRIYPLGVNESLFDDGKLIRRENLQGWMEFLTSRSRSPQLMLAKDDPVVTVMQQFMNKYLSNVRIITAKPERRDPDFVLYDVPVATMNAYIVKPAIFDLFLSALIGLYVLTIYAFVKYFPIVFSLLKPSTIYQNGKSKVH